MRWSKLQRDIYKLIDGSINLQIQCRAYRMPKSRSTNPQLPRYWVTLGRQIIFDIPKETEIEDKYRMYEHIPAVSQLIRDYINSPFDGLLGKNFEDDKFKITDILKAADRRLGKAKLQEWSVGKSEAVKAILGKRFPEETHT